MIGERELGLMKTEAFLVNTCRGMVIDEKALVDALDRGTIAGAGLDVVQREPPEANRPILTHPKAIVTPHAAWYSQESLQRVKDQGLDEVVRVLKGLRPWYAVNPEVLAHR
jgi:D-3-phosphoglycerate dehydrogenase